MSPFTFFLIGRRMDARLIERDAREASELEDVLNCRWPGFFVKGSVDTASLIAAILGTTSWAEIQVLDQQLELLSQDRSYLMHRMHFAFVQNLASLETEQISIVVIRWRMIDEELNLSTFLLDDYREDFVRRFTSLARQAISADQNIYICDRNY